MTTPASLIPELENVIQTGTPERRVQMLKHITALFLDGAGRFNDEHVDLFDDVFGRLIAEIEAKARAELSHRLAPVANAPAGVVRRLANDDDISVAAPVLLKSKRLADSDLVDIVRSKSQAHLLAISSRNGVAEKVTDELVRRGDRAVVSKVAENRKARLSNGSFSTLVSRAERDGELAEKVGLRPDIPPALFRELLLKATELVQQRLLEAADPETQAEIRRVLAKVSQDFGAHAVRDYAAAQNTVDTLRRHGKLDEAALIAFARACQYEETVAALAALCAVPIDVVDRLMNGDRPDPILILCKSQNWGWQTVRVIITARPGSKGTSSQGLDAAYSNFERLSSTTAQRVMRFWQARPDREAAAS